MGTYCNNCMNEINDGGFCTECMAENISESEPHHLRPGTVLNKKYVVGKAIGEGGFGITYIGRDTTLDMKVAIKEYYPNGFVNRNHENTSNLSVTNQKQKEFFEKGKERFLTEARNIAKFNQEKGIVDVRDYFEENGTAYIIMEYLEGVTLSEYVKQNGTMNATQLFTLMKPVMKSLQKMHDKGIIHRDISPDNIMYLKDGTLKLMDFGSARYFNNQDNVMSVVLKMGYSPEEQYRKNGQQGPWTDVYGMCATMYRCITGQVPQEALDRLHEDNIKLPSQLSADITRPLEATLMHGLAVFKENRCQSMNELIKNTEKAIEKGRAPEHNNAVLNDDLYKTKAADKQYATQVADAVYDDNLQSNNKSSFQQPIKPPKQNSINGIFVALVVVIVIIIVVVCAIFAYLFVSGGVFDDNVEETTIVTQAPTEPPTQAPTEPPTEEPKYDVPNVVSLKSESAKDAVKNAGFKPEIEWTDSATVEYGYVINQSPAPSSQAKKGETVTIYVSQTQQLDPMRTMYVSASEYVSLRETPSRSAKSLVQLKYNTPVEVISSSGEFTYVEYKDIEGYILSEFLSAYKDPTPNPGDGNKKDTSPKHYSSSNDIYYCCASNFATLRQTASRQAKELDKIYCREAVEYISSSGEFYYVKFEDKKGYVLKSYFSTDENAPLNYGDS